MKRGPVLTFVTDSIDKYTKVPADPAVKGVLTQTLKLRPPRPSRPL